MSTVTYYTWLKKGNDDYGTFKAIITEKCMSHQMAKKCAGSRLLFNQLQLTFQRDYVQGVSDVLRVDINNKPRVPGPRHQKLSCYRKNCYFLQ